MKVNSFIFNSKDKNSLGYLLYKVLIVILILIIADLLLGFLLGKVISNVPDGRYHKVYHSLYNNEGDILIVGSSRSETHIVPKLLQDSLKMSAWNASRESQGIPYIYCIVKNSLVRYKPKLIIMNVEKYIFSEKMNFQAASIMEPFFSNAIIKELYKDKLLKKSILLNSNLVKYNSSYFYLLRPLIFKNRDGNIEDLGLKPLHGNFVGRKEKETEIVEYYSYEFDQEELELFESTLKLIEDNSINLLMVISPSYNKNIIGSSGLDYLREISNKNSNIELLDYSLDEEFIYQNKYFKDQPHLNYDGAKLLTNKIISDLMNNGLFKEDE